MRIHHELANAFPQSSAVPGAMAGMALTIGVFDGVHRGHQRLIGKVVDEAKQHGCSAGVLTFRNHPDSVFNPDFCPRYITSVPERIRLIKQIGVDFVVPITFDREIAAIRAKDFAAMLCDTLRLRSLVVGPDFAMGYKREGTVDALSAIGADMGFTVSIVELLSEDAAPVSSTGIRHALVRGDVSAAAKMLGRNFTLDGTVVSGEKRGRTLGYPTANLAVSPGMAIPANGIYACRAYVDGVAHMAATSIGVRPTFNGEGRTIEAFLLQFDKDLYNKGLSLEFVQRLRDELKFDSVDDLLEQMRQDVEQTQAILQTTA